MAQRIHRMTCEHPYEKMWDIYVYFENEPTTKPYLHQVYEKRSIEGAQRYAFQNTSKFIYFVKQAREYFATAKQSHILVKPLLIYYGMMSLIKAVVLTMDPTYPGTTSVLRHGITTRKIKKLEYVFHEDEIRVQKEGLVPLFYKLMTGEPEWKHSKFRVKELLSLLPELNESFLRLYGESQIHPLYISDEKERETGRTNFYIVQSPFLPKDNTVLLETMNLFNKGKGSFHLKKGTHPEEYLGFQWEHPDGRHVFDCPDGFENQLFVHDVKGRYYFLSNAEERLLIPELLTHYMLMYNLGMLCRYETELWGEIIFSFSSGDMFMINELLNLSMRKFPNMILNLLFDEVLIFNSF